MFRLRTALAKPERLRVRVCLPEARFRNRKFPSAPVTKDRVPASPTIVTLTPGKTAPD
jgi:hypothetical protein